MPIHPWLAEKFELIRDIPSFDAALSDPQFGARFMSYLEDPRAVDAARGDRRRGPASRRHRPDQGVPPGDTGRDQRPPALLWMHGGGFVMGTVDDTESVIPGYELADARRSGRDLGRLPARRRRRALSGSARRRHGGLALRSTRAQPSSSGSTPSESSSAARASAPTSRPAQPCGCGTPAIRCPAGCCSPIRSSTSRRRPPTPRCSPSSTRVPAMLRFPEQYQLGIVHNYLGRRRRPARRRRARQLPRRRAARGVDRPERVRRPAAVGRAVRLAAEGRRHPRRTSRSPAGWCTGTSAAAPRSSRSPRPSTSSRPRCVRPHQAGTDGPSRLPPRLPGQAAARVPAPPPHPQPHLHEGRAAPRRDRPVARAGAVRRDRPRRLPAASGPARAWGRVFDCAWLRVTGEVPAGVENPVVMLGIGGEGLIYSPDGEVLDAVTTVFQQGDLPHSGGRLPPGDRRRHQHRQGRVPRRRHLQRLHPLPGRQGRLPRRPPRHPRRRDVRPLLRLPHARGAHGVDTGCCARRRPARRPRRGMGSIPRARHRRGASRPRARHSPQSRTSDFVYSAIGHGHLDMAWLWPLRETRRKAARTYTRALNTIAARDGYIYGTSQPQQLYWIKQQHPELYRAHQGRRRIRAHGTAGQLLGRDRHEPAGRRVAGAAGAGRPPVPAGGVRPRPTTTCACAGCPTRSGTTATCRRSCARAAWTGS